MDDKDLIIETMAKHNADLTALVQSLTETIKELEETEDYGLPGSTCPDFGKHDSV